MENKQILRDTKTLLGIDDYSKDEILSIIVDDCVNAVLAYCRIDVLPNQLTGLVAQISAKKYRTEYLSGEAGVVSSVTEGDRRIDFSVPEQNGITEDYAERLKPFMNIKGKVPSEVIK